MYNIMYETSRQSRFDARYWMLGAGALGRPRGMEWGGRREEGSGWETHVYLWRINFDIWHKAEVDVFLELSCFFNDPADVGYLMSCSSAFSKSSLYIWKFSVHVLLKPSLEDFEHYFPSM